MSETKQDYTSAMAYRSPSQITTFLGCGEKYRRRYLEGERWSFLAASAGKAIHVGARLDNQHKLDQGGQAGRKMVVDCAVFSLEEARDEENLIHEGKDVKPNDFIAAIDDVAAGTGRWWDRISPTIEPELVEAEGTAAVTNDEGETMVLKGFIDVVERDGVRDLKTGRRKWAQERVDGSLQLTAYGIIFKAIRGKWPVHFSVDNLVKSAKGWSETLLVTERGEEDYRAAMRQFTTVHKSIVAGLFPPANADDWRCSQKWCEFFSDCPYVGPVRRGR